MVEFSIELKTRIGGAAGGGQSTFKDAAIGLERFSRGAISFDRLDVVIRKTMLTYLRGAADAMRERHAGAWPGGTKPKNLSKRTGDLVQSIAKSIRISGKFTATSDRVGRIGSPLTYAHVQEFGGTITPRNAQYLTVPLPAAMNSAGVMLLPKARDYPNTFVAKSRRGNLIIFQKRGRNKIVPLFVLKRSVKIPPRLNLGAALEFLATRFGDDVIKTALRDFQAGKI